MGKDLGDVKYLFRFRDLVAKTVAEHQRLIIDKGSVWWGWWKRPSEDARQEVWSDLHSATAAAPQAVGLFDSGTGLVYRALVSQVIVPRPDGDPSPAVEDVPDAERELIPEYYRPSPYSRAWMKMMALDGPCDFFERYSLAEPPKLANYSETTLNRLRDKVLVSADELTGMDTTIWHVRRALESDHREKIILTIPALPSAISAEVVRCRSDLVLHITDPHFASGKARGQHAWRLESESGPLSSMTEALRLGLGNDPVGLVVLTGDLTFLGSEEEFDEAAIALRKLLGLLDLSTDHLVVMPGNHDIQWSTEDAYRYGASVSQAPPEARKNYERFYAKLFRHPPSEHLAMGRRFLLPCGIAVEICALNSSTLETGKKFLAGMGRINEGSFGTVARELGWHNNQTASLRVLAIHHHLALTEDLEPEGGFLQGYGLAVDAVRIQRMAAKFGVQLAIHGHKHRSFIWRSSVYELPEHAQLKHKLGELSIVGGGSVGSTDTESASNYFNILSFEPGGLKLTIHRAREQGLFQPIQIWRAVFHLGPDRNRLELGDWEPVGGAS